MPIEYVLKCLGLIIPTYIYSVLFTLQSTLTLLCQNILELTKENKRDALLIQADSLISPLYVPSISLV